MSKLPKNAKNRVAAIDERREKVAELYLAGKSQSFIAQLLGVTQPTISGDLAALREEWQAGALEDFTRAKAEELAKLDNVERVAWESFAISQTPIIVGRPGRNKDGSEREPIDPALMPKRAGDDKWLRIIMNTIDMRCKIFGFVKPPETKYEDNRTVNIDFAQFVQGGAGVPDPVEDMIRAEQVKALPPKGE